MITITPHFISVNRRKGFKNSRNHSGLSYSEIVYSTLLMMYVLVIVHAEMIFQHGSDKNAQKRNLSTPLH